MFPTSRQGVSAWDLPVMDGICEDIEEVMALEHGEHDKFLMRLIGAVLFEEGRRRRVQRSTLLLAFVAYTVL